MLFYIPSTLFKGLNSSVSWTRLVPLFCPDYYFKEFLKEVIHISSAINDVRNILTKIYIFFVR